MISCVQFVRMARENRKGAANQTTRVTVDLDNAVHEKLFTMCFLHKPRLHMNHVAAELLRMWTEGKIQLDSTRSDKGKKN